MKRVLLIGTAVDKKLSEELLTNGVSPQPADNVQRYIISGLQKNGIENLTLLASPRLRAFPSSGIKRVKGSVSREKWGTHITAGFLNLPMLGFWFRERALVHHAKRWALKNRSASGEVIVYSLHSPFLKAAKAIKKLAKNTKICVIIPDLPEYMSRHHGKIKRTLKRVDEKRIKKYMKSADAFAVYTKPIAEKLNVPESRYVVFEGLADESRLYGEAYEKYAELTCMYAGSLNPKFGITTFIRAFSRLKIKARFLIFGNDYDGKIKELCDTADNCLYCGLVSPDAAFEAMKKSHLLINPRPSDLELTRYSFPSKTFEYMASGTPVLMNRLEGIPGEYDQYLFFFDNENEDGYLRTLEKLLSGGEEALAKKGEKALAFIREHKNEIIQTKKLLDVIED